MAAAVTTNAATLEGQLLEVAQAVSAAENAQTDVDNNLTITVDFDASTATIAATMPISAALDASGQTVITAAAYLA